MVRRSTKKVRRQRGSRNMGWGVQKDHKGKGMQGGAGNAGTMNHNYIAIIKRQKAGERIIGKYGFKRPQKRQYDFKSINVSHLDQSIDNLVSLGQAKLTGKTYDVNLSNLGYKKLLAQGEIKRSIKVTVDKASEKAVEKIETAGGKVKLLDK